MGMNADQARIDPKRLASEEALDASVARHLVEAGDLADVVRPINAYFSGTSPEIDRLNADAATMGWRTVRVGDPDEHGILLLWLERPQAVTPDALAALRNDALKIEAFYEVEYDAWDTPVETKRE